MRSEARRKIVCIHITTYRPRHIHKDMDEKINKNCFKGHNKYVCSICLNNKISEKNGECCKKTPKNCPICQKNRDCTIGKKDKPAAVVTEKERVSILKDPNVKTVQTSDSNVAQGLSLLNEVLTVFQNKKVDSSKEKVKPGLFKDAAVSTDDKNDDSKSGKEKDRARLTVSTFQYSIDETKKYSYENGQCVIVNCCQPDYVRKQNSIDLIKHKSCSIPQMKLEELKYSLKEKSRSKDAIEEVNRLFATVRKPGKMTENSNRPMVRNGPRVLPVVNCNYQDNMKKKHFGAECNNMISCKCCQTCMSSGDALAKNDCCHDEKDKCDKCVYMLCCHYENIRKRQNGVLICEHCRDLHEDHYCHHTYVDDSG